MIIKFFKKLVIKRSIFLLNRKFSALQKNIDDFVWEYEMWRDEDNETASYYQEKLLILKKKEKEYEEEMDYLNEKLNNLIDNV